MDFIVGAFNGSSLYTLTFHPPSTSQPTPSLNIVKDSPAIGAHSWLSLSKPEPANSNKADRFLYCTAWTSRPSVVAYRVRHSGRSIDFINAKHIATLSGYTCCSSTHIYSVGGDTGEVYSIGPDGGFGELVQELSFVGQETSERSEDTHGSFGGLRHGAHSVDLSPDGQKLYVADIGRNCVWTYRVNDTGPPNQVQLGLDKNTWSSSGSGEASSHLQLGQKFIASRTNDGPRHTWPHPNGKMLYSLQEHSSMVDLYSIASDGTTLEHIQGVKIIPADKDPKDYWADEVRLSTVQPGSGAAPKYMYASTRGLKPDTKGYVAAFALNEDGTLVNANPSADVELLKNNAAEAIHIWETPTSGGLANAIEPSPWREEFQGVDYLALTDSEESLVMILGFDGKKIEEVARVELGKTDEGKIVGAATAVWL